MPIIETETRDVYRNLAIEEYLLDHPSDRGPTLLLYRNAGAVVIGKNQNPWRECAVERVAAEGLALARRVSGGGAVYHDPGNLNYAFLCPRAEYRAETWYDLVMAALQRLGVEARLMKSTSLAVDGLKISGTAFAFRGGAALHHGTLLITADLERLRRVFAGARRGLETHAIPSVPAAVANLAELAPAIAIEEAAAALRAEFERRFGPAERLDEAALPAAAIEALAAERRRPEWIFDRTPAFAIGRPRGWRARVEEGIVRDLLPPKNAAGAPPESLAATVGRRFQAVASVWFAYSDGTSNT